MRDTFGIRHTTVIPKNYDADEPDTSHDITETGAYDTESLYADSYHSYADTAVGD